MMIDFDEVLNLDETIYETYWPGDPAIDVPASNLDQWYTTGEGLVVKNQQTPSVIRYRGLTPVEQQALSVRIAGAMENQLFEATRYGLVSFDGLSIKWQTKGVTCVSDKTYNILLSMNWPVPVTRIYMEVMKANEDKKIEKKKEQNVEMALPFWLGGLILQRTFRGPKA